MQLEIRNAVERDRLLYNAFDFTAGALIAILFGQHAVDMRSSRPAAAGREEI
jgi:hypothetical protein